jgi:hypothetical protein
MVSSTAGERTMGEQSWNGLKTLPRAVTWKQVPGRGVSAVI